MIKKFKSKLDLHTLEVLVSSSKSTVVKVLGMIAGLLTSIFLARALGTEGLGVVNLINKYGEILLIITLFGLNTVIIKNVSISKSKNNFEDILATVKSSLLFNGFLSVCFAVIGALCLPWIIDFFSGNQELYYPLLIGYLMIIPQTLARVYAAALNGYGKIWQANLVGQTLTSILLLVGLLVLWVFKVSFTPINVLVIYAFSRFIQLFFIQYIWNDTFKYKANVKNNLKPLIKMGLPMLLITGTSTIASNIDTIMLGSLSSLSEVGLYTVAAKIAMLTSFFLAVSNAAIAPKIAALYHKQQTKELEVMVKKTTKILIVIATVTSLLFIVFGKFILGIWGSDFVSGFTILVILSLGQFFNIATGCSGLLLSMTGFEKIHGYISLITLIANIILNIVLINKMGALGAAIATAVTVSFGNIAKLILAKKKTGIMTLPF
ncbi:MAG: O-antigen/teichoic acid export membrane protein [Porticoccaceae bacterium]